MVLHGLLRNHRDVRVYWDLTRVYRHVSVRVYCHLTVRVYCHVSVRVYSHVTTCVYSHVIVRVYCHGLCVYFHMCSGGAFSLQYLA